MKVIVTSGSGFIVSVMVWQLKQFSITNILFQTSTFAEVNSCKLPEKKLEFK